MRREAKTQFTFPVGGSNLAHRIFSDFFLQEVNLRDTSGRAFNPGKGAVQKYEKMLRRMAEVIWNEAARLSLNAVNLTFTFLNRHYPMFIGQSTPVPKMPSFWDEFLIKLSHEPILLSLLNYDEPRRKLICSYIREIQETRKSAKFQTFLKDYVRGFEVKFPDHVYERSMMFETMLQAIKQMEDMKLDYFLQHHAIEVVKAHVWYLKKYGDPVRLTLGCFQGEGALYRLKTYQTWAKRDVWAVKDKPYTYSDRHKPNAVEFTF